ncbi:hypothetical protein [Yoonia sp.]|uniref:hypothetical protein n=1 Tax=Yoonia sp. TaxID=2212373 RepID=UPI003590021B
MKDAAKSMGPDEAAKAFFGQDETTFAEMLADLTANDPRLAAVFLRTRQRFLDKQKS